MADFIYQCAECGKTFQQDEVTYLCPFCAKDWKPGEPLKGVLEAIFDYEKIKKQLDKENPDWSLFSAVDPKYYPNYAVGNTPFTKADRLAELFSLTNLWVKNDGLNPSGSLKDRASFLMVAEANRLNKNDIVAASTGNAASALAAVCAAAGKRAIIFAPATAPKAKLTQILQYGAELKAVNGTYDDAFKLSIEYSKKHGVLNRNTAYHPLTIEGKKTVGLEIFEQNKFKVPEAIIVPVGDGVIIAGVYKAFYDLKEAGFIDHLPKLICVQAENSDAIHRFIETGEYHDAKNPKTIADSISVTTPSNAYLARRAVKKSGGFSVTVTDDEILKAQTLLASTTGIFAEPAAAATVASLKKVRNSLSSDDQIVLLITGNGLKDIDAAMKSLSVS